ncbi:MAG: zf-HC2 domain-containing protein, partial [Anaerolineales bacterium]
MSPKSNVRCQEMRQRLAVYRELSRREQDLLQEHLAGCSSCAATLAAYEAQDELLSALPAVRPLPELVASVRRLTVDRRRPAPRLSWGRVAVTLSLLLLGVVWGGMSIAADSLPGDALYALKRGAEDLRLALTTDPMARDVYREALAHTRREEAREVIRLMREARVEFQGELEEIRDDTWIVAGLAVTVRA